MVDWLFLLSFLFFCSKSSTIWNNQVKDGLFFTSREDGYFEQLNPKTVRNPYIQRLYHSLQHRALHPDEPLPPADPNWLARMTMPAELAKDSEEAREKVKLLFPLKKMEKPKFKKLLGAAE